METTRQHLTELAGALDRETRLVGELRETLVRQRGGVANDDRAIVDATVDDIGRILLALDEARRGRAWLVTAITGDPAFPLSRLEQRLDGPIPEALVVARAGLRDAARQASADVAINHGVLGRAVEAGEAFLQQLFAATADPPVVYGSGEPDDVLSSAPGALLDRSA